MSSLSRLVCLVLVLLTSAALAQPRYTVPQGSGGGTFWQDAGAPSATMTTGGAFGRVYIPAFTSDGGSEFGILNVQSVDGGGTRTGLFMQSYPMNTADTNATLGMDTTSLRNIGSGLVSLGFETSSGSTLQRIGRITAFNNVANPTGYSAAMVIQGTNIPIRLATTQSFTDATLQVNTGSSVSIPSTANVVGTLNVGGSGVYVSGAGSLNPFATGGWAMRGDTTSAGTWMSFSISTQGTFRGAMVGVASASTGLRVGTNFLTPASNDISFNAGQDTSNPNAYFAAGSPGTLNFVRSTTGTNAIAFGTNGMRHDFGGGTNDYLASNGTNLTTASLLLDASPKLWSAIYINAVTIAGTKYGGETLPTVSGATLNIQTIRLAIRGVGTGGTTNAIFRVSDGTNNCDCPFACNIAGPNIRVACAGTCAFASAASLSYTMNSIGNCVAGPDILGNVQVEGAYQ